METQECNGLFHGVGWLGDHSIWDEPSSPIAKNINGTTASPDTEHLGGGKINIVDPLGNSNVGESDEWFIDGKGDLCCGNYKFMRHLWTANSGKQTIADDGCPAKGAWDKIVDKF